VFKSKMEPCCHSKRLMCVGSAVAVAIHLNNTLSSTSMAFAFQNRVISRPSVLVRIGDFVRGNNDNDLFSPSHVSQRVDRPTSLVLRMGLYDQPLPPPPSDDFAEEYQQAKRDKQFQKWNPDGAEKPEEQEQRRKMFVFDNLGRDQMDILPALGRNPNLGIESFYEASDSLVRQLLRMTRCHPDDACWALEAHKGNVMEASVSIALAQRQILNDQVALPDQEEVANTDWDDELSSLVKRQSSENKGTLGKNFEDDGYSVGLDGLEERQNFLKKRAMKNESKKWLQGGKLDQDWIPGGNPNPVDDEPWFTG
jgi:hypothetical protein